MRIRQTTNGFDMENDNGDWLLSFSGKERYWRKLDETRREYDTYEARYVRDGNNNIVIWMYADGGFKHRVFDEWNNLIAEWVESIYSSGSKLVYTYEYAKRRDGTVAGTRVNTKRFDNYWKWLAAIQTTFEVKEYVEPDCNDINWHDVKPIYRNAFQRFTYDPYVVRSAHDGAVFGYTPVLPDPVEPVNAVDSDWVSVDEASLPTNARLNEAYRRLQRSDSRRVVYTTPDINPF